MEFGIGVDIVEIQRLKSAILDPSQPLRLVLTQREIIDNSKPETLAGILASKEALVKATSLVLNLSPLDVEVKHHANGKPYFYFHDTPLNSQIRCDLTISHTETLAISVVQCLFEPNLHSNSGEVSI